jgi:hypothetical protein
MANTLSDVQATFQSLDAQYNFLLAGCQTQAQRDALAAQYAAAQENYQSALNATLTDDDAQVAALSTQLKAANAQVVQATAQLGNISKVISDVTTAVSLGAQLVAMA